MPWTQHSGTDQKGADMLLNRPKAHALLQEAGIDAVVLTYTENVMYFSDFLEVNSNRLKSRLYYLVFFADERTEPAFLVPHQDFEDTKRQSWIKDVRPTSEYPFGGRDDVILHKEREVAEILRERGLSHATIGFENESLPFDVYERLRSELAGSRLTGVSSLIRKLRAIKSPEEMLRIRKAMDATQAGARAILEAAAQGVTERDLASQAKQACFAAGADAVDFVIVGAGKKGAIVHGAPSDYQLKDGDIVRFDLGAVFEGYPGDFARTFVVGPEAAERDRRQYDAVHAAVTAGIEAAKPGATAGEVYDAQMRAGRAIEPGLKREHSGHGLGLEIHEEPMIYHGSEFLLEPGMVVMIENGRYILGQGGYQLEDLVLITDDGNEVITDVPRELVRTA